MRIGRRGAILLCAAWIVGWLGVMLLTEVRPLPPAADTFSAEAWGVIWMVVATICATSAAARRDAWGFSTASALLAYWAWLWFRSWLSTVSFWSVTWSDIFSEPMMWTAVWLGGTGIMLICAGWREE